MTHEVMKKVCLLGDRAVGKTSLIRRYVYDVFDDKYISTIGTKVTKKVLEFTKKDVRLTLLIWDLAGETTFNGIHRTYYKGAEGAIVVCDVTSKETFEHLPYWVESIMDVQGDIPVMFFGNKIDLKDQIVIKEKHLKKMAKKFKKDYFFTSAKTGENVNEGFYLLGRKILEL